MPYLPMNPNHLFFISSPFGFAGADKQSLIYMREAEIKHSRLAMLAVVGWPLAELWDKPLADATGLPSLLTKSGESPSLLNGGLDKVDAVYWVAVVLLAGIVELENAEAKEDKKAYVPGDCNFDPLNLFPTDKEGQKAMMTKEIKHGRIAMMAILGFLDCNPLLVGIPLYLFNIPVVDSDGVLVIQTILGSGNHPIAIGGNIHEISPGMLGSIGNVAAHLDPVLDVWIFTEPFKYAGSTVASILIPNHKARPVGR